MPAYHSPAQPYALDKPGPQGAALAHPSLHSPAIARHGPGSDPDPSLQVGFLSWPASSPWWALWSGRVFGSGQHPWAFPAPTSGPVGWVPWFPVGHCPSGSRQPSLSHDSSGWGGIPMGRGHGRDPGVPSKDRKSKDKGICGSLKSKSAVVTDLGCLSVWIFVRWEGRSPAGSWRDQQPPFAHCRNSASGTVGIQGGKGHVLSSEEAARDMPLLPPSRHLRFCAGATGQSSGKRAMPMLRRGDCQLSPCHTLSERVAQSAEVKNCGTKIHRNKTC